MRQIQRNYIKTRKEFGTFYKKSIGVLVEIILGNIKKERLNLKELIKELLLLSYYTCLVS